MAFATNQRKNVCNDITHKGLVSKTQMAHTTHYKTNKHPNQKIVKTWIYISSKNTNIQMAKWHMKTCSTFLIIWEMKIKTTMHKNKLKMD